MKATKLKDGTVNLRGMRALFDLDGRQIIGTIVTHIRNGRWMIESRKLPREYARNGAWWSVRRIVLPRDQFTVIP